MRLFINILTVIVVAITLGVAYLTVTGKSHDAVPFASCLTSTALVLSVRQNYKSKA